jgi:hypothetical protein
MNVKLTIGIKGVALLQPIEHNGTPVWRVLFPFENEDPNDDCHNVRVSLKKIMPTEEQIWDYKTVKKNRVMSLVLSDIRTVGNPATRLFSLNDTDAHGLPGSGRPGVEPKPSGNRMELNLPRVNFQGFPADETAKPLYVLFERINDLYFVRKEPFRITTGVEAEVLTMNNTLELEVSGDTPSNVTLTDGAEYELIFDNDCSLNDRSENDFKLVYKHLIRERGNPNRQFELEWVPEFLANTLRKNTPVPIWLYLILQESGRFLLKRQDKENHSKNKHPLVSNDITYPCFVYESEGG